MEISTRHCDDDVEVELELMANTALDGEVVCFSALEIGSYFSNGKESTEYDEGEGPLSASRSGRCVCRFRFGWSLSVRVQATRLRVENSLDSERQHSASEKADVCMRLTKCIKSLQASEARFLPERIVVQPQLFKGIHMSHGSSLLDDRDMDCTSLHTGKVLPVDERGDWMRTIKLWPDGGI